MLGSPWISVPVGGILGFLGGLGIGGGSLLVLWLTLILGTDYSTARGINLLFFLPCAVCSLIFRSREQNVPYKKIIPAMVCGCIAAAVFSWLGRFWNIQLLQKLFGGILILTGMKELFYRPRKAR